MSHTGAHLPAENSVSLWRVELPFSLLLLCGAVRSLQCSAVGFFSTLLHFKQSSSAASVPFLHAAGRFPAGVLPDLTPHAAAFLHLAAPAVAAAVRRAQALRGAGRRRSLCLAVLSGTVRLMFALVFLIVTSQPVNGVVWICSRHSQLQTLTSTDHHWPGKEKVMVRVLEE